MSVTLETAERWMRSIAERNGQSDTEQSHRLVVAELDRLRAALAAVLALHGDGGVGMGYKDEGGYGDIPHACGTCGQHDEYAVPWPCPTAIAAGAEQ